MGSNLDHVRWLLVWVCICNTTYHAAAAGGATTLLDFFAVAAHLDKDEAEALCLCREALQELGPAGGVSTHGRVYFGDVLIARPGVAEGVQVAAESVVGVAVGVKVGAVVAEQQGHAADCALNCDVSVEQLDTIGAVVEQAVKVVDVLHGDAQAFVAEEHVFEALIEVVVCALEEAVELVDVLEQDIGDVGG